MTFKWPDVSFTDTKCMGILKMKLIIIVMIKDVRHFQKYDYDVTNCSLDWTESRTPSVCNQTNTKCLVRCSSYSAKHLLFLFVFSGFFLLLLLLLLRIDCLQKNTYLQTSHDLTFTSCPNRKSRFNIFKKIISQNPQEVNSQFLHHCTDR